MKSDIDNRMLMMETRRLKMSTIYIPRVIAWALSVLVLSAACVSVCL